MKLGLLSRPAKSKLPTPPVWSQDSTGQWRLDTGCGQPAPGPEGDGPAGSLSLSAKGARLPGTNHNQLWGKPAGCQASGSMSRHPGPGWPAGRLPGLTHQQGQPCPEWAFQGHTPSRGPPAPLPAQRVPRLNELKQPAEPAIQQGHARPLPPAPGGPDWHTCSQGLRTNSFPYDASPRPRLTRTSPGALATTGPAWPRPTPQPPGLTGLGASRSFSSAILRLDL